MTTIAGALNGSAPDLAETIEALLSVEGIVLARASADLIPCPECQLFFAPSRKGQTYCRPACRQAAYEDRVSATSTSTSTWTADAQITREVSDEDMDDVFEVVPPGAKYPPARPRKP